MRYRGLNVVIMDSGALANNGKKWQKTLTNGNVYGRIRVWGNHINQKEKRYIECKFIRAIS